MSADRVDVIVIGAGLAGSAAAWALVRRGRSVAVLEAFQAGHRRGSSHGSARIFRRAYPDPLYVRLTGQAQRLWRLLADEAGEEVVLTTGGLDFGSAGGPANIHEILTDAGVPAELMAAEAAAERWPHVHTADRSWQASAVIVAAGPWLEPLLGGQVGLPPLTVTQQSAFHFAPRIPADPGTFPVFICHDEVAVYGLPAGRDGEVPGAVKVAEHSQGTITTADGRDGIVDPAVRERVSAFVQARFGGLDPAPVGEVTCLYTATASDDFVLDRRGPFVVCSACSGHGAKFAPLTGEFAAELACGGATPDRRFSLAAHGA